MYVLTRRILRKANGAFCFNHITKHSSLCPYYPWKPLDVRLMKIEIFGNDDF